MSRYPLEIDATKPLCAFAADLGYFDLPDRTKANVDLFFLDYVAAIHAGYRVNRAMNEAVKGIAFEDVVAGKSHVLFSANRTSPLSASFVNAFYAHGADMDDGSKLAAGHIGAHVISALMSLAEARDSLFEDFYAAMAAGYEVYCRLSSACMPHLVDRGFHSTGTAGALASAVACARLLGLDAESVANAMSLSATQASGLLLAGETRQDMKALNPANAARVGVFSALLAEKGVKGPLNPLESSKGWCHAMAPSVDFDRLLGGLGERFCIDQCYMKPYPSCRHTHCAIEAALEIGESIDPNDVECIDVVTYGHAIDLAGRIDVPRTVGESKFSIKYAVTAALFRKRFALEDLEPRTINELELALIKKVRLMLDDSYERPAEGVRGAKLIVRMMDGDVLRKEVLVPKGDPENPFAETDLEEKLRCCFSDATGNPHPEGAASFLEWYRPIAGDPSNRFVFPDREVAR